MKRAFVLALILLIPFSIIVSAQTKAPTIVLNFWNKITGTDDIMNTNPGSVGIGTTGPFKYNETISGGNQTNSTLVTKNARLPTPQTYFSCAEDSSSHLIYCFGGYDSTNQNLLRIVQYNALGDVLSIKSATLPSFTSFLSCAEDSNTHKIYCFGGRNGAVFYNQVLEYDPSSDSLNIKSATLPQGTYFLSCVEQSSTHKIYCFGGDTNNGVLSDIIEYDPSSDTLIKKAAKLSTPHAGLSCSEHQQTHTLYCFGGYDSNGRAIDEIFEYDPTTDTINLKSARLSTPLEGLSCSFSNVVAKFYCGGGRQHPTYPDDLLEYDPSTDLIRIDKHFTSPRYGVASSQDSSTGKLYFFGGIYVIPSGNVFLDEIVEYTPAIPSNPPQTIERTIKLRVDGGDFLIGSQGAAIILRAEDNPLVCWRFTVTSQGEVKTNPVLCP